MILPVDHDAAGQRLSSAVALVTLGVVTWAQLLTGGGPGHPGHPVRIMPLGDSITVGYNAGDGYRGLLQDQLVGPDGLDVEFVGGEQTSGSGPHHEGHGGFRIDQVRALLDDAITTQAPDVVLVHLGTNDVGQRYRLDTAPQRLQELLGRVCTLRPEAEVFVASLITINGMEDVIGAYNAQVPSVVARLQADGCRTHFVDMSHAVPAAELPDGVHPDAAGYARMADVWHRYVRAVIGRTPDPAVPSAVNDDALVYTGYWHEDLDRTGAHRSDRHVSANTGDVATHRFTGALVLRGTRGPDGGLAAVSVDGGPETVADFYGPDEQEQAVVWTSPPTGAGPHVLRIRVTGRSSPASAGTAVSIDRLDVTGP